MSKINPMKQYNDMKVIESSQSYAYWRDMDWYGSYLVFNSC